MKTWIASCICILCLYIIWSDTPRENKACKKLDKIEGSRQGTSDQGPRTRKKSLTLHHDSLATGIASDSSVPHGLNDETYLKKVNGE